ncbi:transcriptional regulation of mitochondrial recombination-domain-containing protein [Peziza echinospora]|nr:transcriptional regulation of mitochondrial recombination-domain-containing protein [Peziza echinospora]
MAANVLTKAKAGPHPLSGQLGKVLFIYSEVYTKQVVYSLVRTMKNNAALKQIAFVGKQSVPKALRKDRWAPLACVHFPTTEFGLNAFRMLREFRMMHETQYDPEILKSKLVERKKILQDQKANSIADLAEVLKMELAKLPPNETGKGTVVIKWQDVLDGEFAKQWPEPVEHHQGSQPERFAFSKYDLPEEQQALLNKKKGRSAPEVVVSGET